MRRLSPLALGALLAFPFPAIAAEELPKRRAGLWESTVVGSSGTQSVKQCIDENTDRLALGAVMGPNTCTQTRFVKNGDAYEVEATCKIGPMTSKGISKISGDFNSKLKIEVATEVAGAPGKTQPIHSKSVQESSYIGPCTDGLSPGDIVLPDGKVIKTPGTPK